MEYRRAGLVAGLVLAFLSAGLLALAHPMHDLQYLAWFGLVPLFLLIRTLPPRRSMLFAWCTGFLFYLLLLRWTLNIEGMKLPRFVLMTALMAWHVGIFGLVAGYLHGRLPGWSVLTFPCLWVSLEFLKTRIGFLSIPFGVLGYTQHAVLPVAKVSAYMGVYGVSFLLAVVNAFLSDGFDSLVRVRRGNKTGREEIDWGWKRPVAVLGGTVILFAGLSVAGPVSGAGSGKRSPMKMALVQGNSYWDPRRDPLETYVDKVFRIYQRLTREAAAHGPALIIWPSSSVPGRIPYDRRVVNLLGGMAREMDAFLLVGTAGFDKFNPAQQQSRRIANSAFLFSPAGYILGQYDKIRLLPFDEYLPLRGIVPWPSFLVDPNTTDHHPGTEMTIFRVRGTHFGVLICSENLLPEVFRDMASRGVDFMVSMTNEGFADIPVGHYQLLAMNRFRAIENHIPIARIDTSGVSCLFDDEGHILGKVQNDNGRDIALEGFIVGDLVPTPERTFYTKHGDVFAYMASSIGCAFLLAGFLKRRDSRTSE